jgi:EAL domain-containing protein (putative c-di-GMP-specific phosphodiesterase class I)/GGDEF domain-containing protein
VFKRLSTRLTVLYAALFGAVLAVMSVAVFLAISSAAQRQVRAELAATGGVFDRVWSLRSERLSEGANLLSRDFGFREAVATRDEPTIVSAMENLRRRLGIDQAFMVGADGQILGARLSPAEARQISAAFEAADDPKGVFMLNDEPFQLVSAPVFSPELIGWVVFAVRLDRQEMAALEKLSSIPLSAVVLHREPGHDWTNHHAGAEYRSAAVRRFVEQSLAGKAASPEILDLHGPSVALVKTLPTLEPNGGAVLLLRYPLARALAPYQTLLVFVVLIGVAGLAVVGWGSWILARGVTRPVSELDAAAQRLQRGEDAQVEIATGDELGRLAASFNTMAAEIRDRERKITHLALHDGETGLPNRLALERVVEQLADQPAGQAYVAALGIERFNHVRGAIGYQLAAQAVRMIGNRLAGLAPTAGVARVATDVLGFVLVAEHAEAAADDAQRLLAQLEQPIRVAGEAIDVALAVGLAPLDGAPGEAIERASIALDQARAARRKAGFFDAEAYGDPASNLSLMSSLLAGLDAGEVELHHQPKFDFRRRQVCGTEGLVRWRHPTRGMLRPDLFIPMAEETGHIRTLTEWVVRQAIADQRALAAAGHDLDVAVNISGRTLSEPDFADFVERELRAGPARLRFEITETAVIENPDVAMAMLERFGELGVQVAIDDFGAGLSSLAYLKRIRAQELKIDKSIIEGVTGSQRDALIVRSTVDLAHSLGLKVTAEGVETNACFSLLAAMGCDLAQGYLVARPQPLSDLFEFLAETGGELRNHG